MKPAGDKWHVASDVKRCTAQNGASGHSPSVTRHSAGFTLIELILVLALLVIITSIAVPSMSRFIRGQALGSEAQRLIALMHAAQSRAVSEGAPMVLWIDEQGGVYGAEAETSGQDGDGKAERLTVDSTLTITVLDGGTGVVTLFKDLPAIRFLPDGAMDENSLKGLRLVDADGFARELTPNKTRTGYEVGDINK
jgi:type II secretion system protein H